MTDDDINAKVDALSTANSNLWDRIDDLEAENADLRERVTALEDLIHVDLQELEYSQLTKKDKVRAVQEELTKRAEQNGGKAAMTYKDVKWHFDGQPSAGHAYDLMKVAAEEQGFTYEERANNQANRVLVNLDAVNAEAGFHGANKPSTSTTP